MGKKILYRYLFESFRNKISTVLRFLWQHNYSFHQIVKTQFVENHVSWFRVKSHTSYSGFSLNFHWSHWHNSRSLFQAKYLCASFLAVPMSNLPSYKVYFRDIYWKDVSDAVNRANRICCTCDDDFDIHKDVKVSSHFDKLLWCSLVSTKPQVWT